MTSNALQRLERAGLFAVGGTSLHACAAKLLLAACGTESDRGALTAFNTVAAAASWRAAAGAVEAAGDAAYITEPVLQAIGVSCATAIARLLATDATLPTTVPCASIRDTCDLLCQVAGFASLTRRSLVNLDSATLRAVVVANASCAIDLFVLATRLSDPGTELRRLTCAATDGDFTALAAAAAQVATATVVHCQWCFSPEPNAPALAAPQISVSQALIEAKKIPTRITGSVMTSSRAAMCHSRPITIKAAALCSAFDAKANSDSTVEAPSAGAKRLVEAAYAFLTAVTSTPSARAAVFYRFDGELMLMNNTSAADCRVLLATLQRTPFAVAAKRKPGQPPVSIDKAVDGLCECAAVLEAVFTAFTACRHWRSFMIEKRRVMLAKAVARPNSSAAAAALGADAKLQSVMLEKYDEREDAIGRLSHGGATLTDDTARQARDHADAAQNEIDELSSQDGGDTASNRSDVGATTDGARSADGRRSEGGYTHMSARTAATTTRGRAVVEAVNDLFLDADLQRAAEGAANVNLPLVLLELTLAWCSRAVDAILKEFPIQSDQAPDQASTAAFQRATAAVWRLITSMMRTASNRDVFSAADDSRFNAGLGLTVLETSVFAGLVLPALSYCTSGVVPAPEKTATTKRLGHQLCQLAARADGGRSLLLRHICDAVVILNDAVPAAVQRRLPDALLALCGPVSDSPDVACSVDAAVSKVLCDLAKSLGTANRLPQFLAAVHEALVARGANAVPATDAPCVLARVLLRDVAVATPEAATGAAADGGGALRDAVAMAASTALDPESVVAAIQQAINAAVASEDEDDDDDEATVAEKKTLAAGRLSLSDKAALIALCDWAMRGIKPTSLNALPLLETIVEIDVAVATHTAANVLTRISTVDEALTAAAQEYEAKSTLKRLRAVTAAAAASVQERFVAVQWMLLLDSSRRVAGACAQDLGVSSPESFLQTMEEGVWMYGTDIASLLASFTADDISQLLAFPTEVSLPSPQDVDDAATRAHVEHTLRDMATVSAAISSCIVTHVGQRLVRGAATLGALRLPPTELDSSTTRAVSVAGVLVSSPENRAAAEAMAAYVHKQVGQVIDGASTSVAWVLEHLYPGDVGDVCCALHPNGATRLAATVINAASTRGGESTTAADAVAVALCRRLKKTVGGAVAHVATLWTATKKNLLSKPFAEALALYGGSTSATSPSAEELTDAREAIQSAVAVTRAVHGVLTRRGGLPEEAYAATSAIFDAHAELLRCCLTRPEFLALSPKPSSALAEVVALISATRRFAADALRLTSALRPSEIPAVLSMLFAARRASDDSQDDDAPAEHPTDTWAALVSDCVATVSVDGEGTHELLASLITALTTTVPHAAKCWPKLRGTYAEATLSAVASAAEELAKSNGKPTDPAFTRFIGLLSSVSATPRFLRLMAASSAVAEPATTTSAPAAAEQGDEGAEPSPRRSPRAEARQSTAVVDGAVDERVDSVLGAFLHNACALCHKALVEGLRTIQEAATPVDAKLAATLTAAASTLRLLLAFADASAAGKGAAVKRRAAEVAKALHADEAFMSSLSRPAGDSAQVEAECLAAAWAVCAAAGATQGPRIDIVGRGTAAIALVGFNAMHHVQRSMQQADDALRNVALKWVTNVAKVVGPLVASGAMDVGEAARRVVAYLTLPNTKVKPVRSLLIEILASALRSANGQDLADVLGFCRLPLGALHKDGQFLTMELAVITRALAVQEAQAAALAAASKTLVMLVTTFPDVLLPAAAELPICVQLLTRCTLSGLRDGTLDATAASLLGAALYHLSRHKVLSLVGRGSSSALAASMAYAMFAESSKYLSTASLYSLELDTCGFDIIAATQDRIDLVFGALRHDPQAQSLLRRAVSRLSETKDDQVVIDAGIAMPSRGAGPIAFAS